MRAETADCVPRSARTCRRSALTGSMRSRFAAYIHRSIVEALNFTGASVVGCCHVCAASAAIARRTPPRAVGGAANS
jgi:hypothetical protein